MVSFFGLKLGGDKKKGQNKQIGKPQGNLKNVDPNTFGEVQGFNPNFSRPNRLSRPGTSYSTRSSNMPTNWRAPYMQGPGGGATSSLVDLAAPGRRPSVSSLRQPSSDFNLKAKWDSGAATAVPSPLAKPAALSHVEPSVSRPSTPPRTSSRRSEWINPLEGPYSRDPASGSRPATPVGTSTPTMKSPVVAAGSNSPFSSFEFGLGNDTKKDESVSSINGDAASITTASLTNGSITTVASIKGEESLISNKYQTMTRNGYPSPPQSVLSSERSFSPVNFDQPSASRPSSNRPNAPTAPSALRRVDTAPAGQIGLPSPSVSPLTPGDDKTAVEGSGPGPVIRNVRAKRDTMAFHQPRRRSLTMEVDGDDLREKLERRRQQQELESPVVGGFAGDFAGFDFGQSVKRPDVDAPRPATSAGPAAEARKAKKTPSLDRAESPMGTRWQQPHVEEKRSVSAATTTMMNRARGMSEVTPQDIPSRETQPFKSLESNKQQPSHAPAPLQLRGPHPESTSPTLPRPPTLSRPTTLAEGLKRRTVAPAAAAGAHPGNSSPTSPSFDTPPPPLSMRSRIDSTSRTRKAPPRPLTAIGPGSAAAFDRVTALTSPSTDGSKRSPYGPPPEEGSYMRDDVAPPRPIEQPAAPSSPYTRPPIEGDFPVSKGLPRGRQPMQSPSSTTNNNSSSTPRRPRRSDESSLTGGAGTYGFSSTFDASDRHRSAIPAPLSPIKSDGGTSPGWLGGGGPGPSLATPTSATAPRLPSPTFLSLEKSISGGGGDLGLSFDFSFDEPFTGGSSADEMGETGRDRERQQVGAAAHSQGSFTTGFI